MKLKSLKSVLASNHGDLKRAMVFDSGNAVELENGCTTDYAIKTYGDWRVIDVGIFRDQFVLSVKKEG